jgi:hypothetical protein
MMTTGSIVHLYKAMSQEDQRTFKRWGKANAVVMLIFAVAFAAVALGGSSPSFHAGRIAPVANQTASLAPAR